MDLDFAMQSLLVQPKRLTSGFCSSTRTFVPRFFRTRLLATPLCFTNPSPPSGWVEDFHFLAAGHAQHTPQAPPWSPADGVSRCDMTSYSVVQGDQIPRSLRRDTTHRGP